MPDCAKCNQKIKGQYTSAFGKFYHLEHFTCSKCDTQIRDEYLAKDDTVYCSNCYEDLFLVKCNKCGLPIKDTIVTAMGADWHEEHFICEICGDVIGLNPFYEFENKSYCQNCYKSKVAPVCAECGKHLEDSYVEALGKQYHPECFKCSKCGEVIEEEIFSIINEKAYHDHCAK